MFLYNFLFKIKYPLLKFFSLKNFGGVYSSKGQDIFMLKYLYNFLSNNDNVIFIELNTNPKEQFLLSNLFFRIFKNDFIYVDLNKKLIVECLKKNKIKIHGSSKLNLGIDLSFYENCRHYALTNFLNDLAKFPDCFFNLIVYFDKKSINLFFNILEKKDVKTIFIQGNKIYWHEIKKIHNKLFMLGFVFHSRLNGKDDFFIKSEMVNGFSSKMIEKYSLGSLNKWISDPPDSDYTKPR